MKRDSLVQTQRHRRDPARLACALLSALLTSLGCRGGDAHELGYTTEARRVDEDPVQPDEPYYADRDEFIGRWLGQAREPLAFGVEDDEAAPTYAFPSGSTQIVLDIAPRTRSSDPVRLGGSITFGSGQSPPAASDPDRGYPVGFDYDQYRSYDEAAGRDNYDDGLPPLEGFRYVIESKSFADEALERVPDGVLRMMYNPYAHLQSWCALHEPQLLQNGTFRVLPESPGGYDAMADGTDRECSAYDTDLSGCPQDLQTLPPDEYRATYAQCVQQGDELYRMSCDKMYLSQFCSCTARLCDAGTGARVSLLLRASGDVLIGMLEGAMFLNARGLSTPLGEMRFRRLPD